MATCFWMKSSRTVMRSSCLGMVYSFSVISRSRPPGLLESPRRDYKSRLGDSPVLEMFCESHHGHAPAVALVPRYTHNPRLTPVVYYWIAWGTHFKSRNGQSKRPSPSYGFILVSFVNRSRPGPFGVSQFSLHTVAQVWQQDSSEPSSIPERLINHLTSERRAT